MCVFIYVIIFYMKYALRNKGFTLIELLVVIAIIGLLATVVISSMRSAKLRAQDARRIEDIASIKKALELYSATNSHFPDSLDEMTHDPDRLLSVVPSDPDPSSGRVYEYATSTDATDYVLKATLSTKDRALNYDSDISKYGVVCDGNDSALIGPYDYCINP